MTTQELLEQSFETNLSNYGPEDVERLNDWAIKAYAALKTLQAENAQWRVDFKEMVIEHDAVLARLAEIESTYIDEVMNGLMLEKSLANLKAQEPVGYASKEDIVELQGANGMSVWCESRKMWGGSGDPPLPSNLTPIYAAAGASPVGPSQARELSDDEVMRCISESACYGTVRMSFESGPYSIDKPSLNATKFASAIIAAIKAKERAAHGIKQGGQHD